MKKLALLLVAALVCTFAIAAPATDGNTAALLAQVRTDCGWMDAGDSAYRGSRLQCSLLGDEGIDVQTFGADETYVETVGCGTDLLAVFGAFATTHAVEAFMDSEFMPSGDIGRPEYFDEIAGEPCNQYRFTTDFADAQFAVDAFSFSVEEQVFLFLTARRIEETTPAAEAEYLIKLDEWIRTMQVVPAE